MGEELQELRRVKQKYEEYLLGVKGVTGIGVNGSIVVFVDRLTPELRQVLPRQLDGIPVRVKETGIIRLQALRPLVATFADRVERWRPAPGGVSIGHPLLGYPELGAGTLGCRVADKRSLEIIGGLTNNHVAALDWGEKHVGKVGDSTLQPGTLDGGLEPYDKLGELLKWLPVVTGEDNPIDAAIFESDELRRDVYEIGNPSYTVEPRLGMNVLKSGRTSGVTFGQVTFIYATLNIKGGEGWGECRFTDQIIIEPTISFPGDSGSWVGEIDTYNTVGLIFAGSETISVANRALSIEELLEVIIVPPVPSMKLSNFAALWMGALGIGLAVHYGSPPHEHIGGRRP